MLNGSLAMSELPATILPFQAAQNPRSYKSATSYSLFDNVSHAKAYPDTLNISLSIPI